MPVEMGVALQVGLVLGEEMVVDELLSVDVVVLGGVVVVGKGDVGDDVDVNVPIVDIERVVEPLVIVELEKTIEDKLVCVELGGIFVPVVVLKKVPVEVDEALVDVLFETTIVDDDTVPDPDVELVEAVNVSVPELDCELIRVDEALDKGVELEPSVSVLVPLDDELLEIDDEVNDPDPELVTVVLVDGFPVVGDTMLVMVVFQGPPVTELEITVVVVGLEEVTKVDVSLPVIDMLLFVAIPLVEPKVKDTVVVIGAPFVLVLVIVVTLARLEVELLVVGNPDVVVVLPLELGPLVCEGVGELVSVVPELIVPKAVDKLEGSDVVFTLTASPVEEVVIPLKVCVPEADEPGGLTAVPLSPVAEALLGGVGVNPEWEEVQSGSEIRVHVGQPTEHRQAAI
ncbi:hypothetical protein GGR51DRAFT_554772 [Nemania sp. FL0031]|nr:hypothetical protein GGR51DRAFT_554772 [Nemania sp. FL0031]